LPEGLVDFLLKFPPGFLLVGILQGWGPLATWILGRSTYICSSSIIARILREQGWLQNRETNCNINILVFKDLIMAMFLPLTIVLLSGENFALASLHILITVIAAALFLIVAILFLIFLIQIGEVPQ
jgi:Kef-type K+ transport system membrane component KefB